MVVCQDITKSFRGRIALQPLTLTLAGGITALLGANGAGKSTLLKLLTGMQPPDSGTVTLDGLDLSRNAAAVKQILGVLPEELGLFEQLTILEHLQMTGPIYGLSAHETSIRADSLLSLLALEHGRHTLVSECSYGMRKKTALAMALLHHPRVLILDEPFEGIDPTSSRLIQNTLTHLAAHGVTILLTSHILPLVEGLASRILILKQGSLLVDSDQHGPIPSLEALYFELVGDPRAEELPWLGS